MCTRVKVGMWVDISSHDVKNDSKVSIKSLIHGKEISAPPNLSISIKKNTSRLMNQGNILISLYVDIFVSWVKKRLIETDSRLGVVSILGIARLFNSLLLCMCKI